MLTVGELQYWLNMYLARSGLSPDAVMKVGIFTENDESWLELPVTTISCHVEHNISTVWACGDPEESINEDPESDST